ncbi:MAG: YafY family protein [Ktedonobacterales bacterium]
MRADRLLSILLLLQTQRRMTARELSKRLEVSARTIHRDMEALGMAGVPVTAERGSGGGWRLLEEYRTNLTGMNEAEAQALLLGGPSRLLGDLGLRQAAEGGLIKLLAALPGVNRDRVGDIRQRIHIDAAGWRQSSEPTPLLPTLQEAIWSERKLRLGYQRDGGIAERLVDPLGLVAKGSVWYLVAAVAGEPRTYRVSRIDTVMLLDEPCERPADFDLATFWEHSTAEFTANLPRYQATLRVTAEALRYIRQGGRYARIESESAADADGWITVSMLFEEQHGAREFTLGFGAQAEVIEPPELREQVICEARALLARYAQ